MKQVTKPKVVNFPRIHFVQHDDGSVDISVMRIKHVHVNHRGLIVDKDGVDFSIGKCKMHYPFPSEILLQNSKLFNYDDKTVLTVYPLKRKKWTLPNGVFFGKLVTVVKKNK